jgi:hypothetical protein
LIGSAVIVELLFPFRRYDRDVLHVELIMVLQVAMNARVLRIRSKLEPRKQENTQRKLAICRQVLFLSEEELRHRLERGLEGQA